MRENAALLKVLRATGLPLAAGALTPLEGFYAQIEQRIGFLPHEYRALLSICLDLEDLGLPGRKGEALAHWAARAELADGELSDLSRLEARHLMWRRGIDPLPEDEQLEERIRAYIDRCDAFAIPNRRAGQALAQIVFFLGHYGRRDPRLSVAARTSLGFAGLLAWLEQNAALLAAICLALRHAGAMVPDTWQSWLEQETARYGVVPAPRSARGDDCQGYLMCNWFMADSGGAAFSDMIPQGRFVFQRPSAAPGPLRDMTQRLFRMGDARSDDWEVMRAHVQAGLGEAGHGILRAAEQSGVDFGAFFSAFARTGLCGARL